MELDNVLKRIRKCLALSKSSNEHEAAAALRQAQKLMAAYNVTQEALDGAEVGVSEAKATAWTRVPQWEVMLANLLREAFGCEIILVLGGERVLARIQFIGLRQNAELAAYTHEVMQRQIVKARALYLSAPERAWMLRGEKINSGESFCIGFIGALRKQVQAFANPAAIDSAVQRKKEELLGPKVLKFKPTHRGPLNEGFYAGAEAGSKAALHRPMGGGAEQLKLGSGV